MFYAIFSNLIFIILFAIAYSVKKNNMAWFTIGVILQGFCVFGSISRMVRTQEIYSGDVAADVLFIVLAVGGYFLLKKSIKKNAKQQQNKQQE